MKTKLFLFNALCLNALVACAAPPPIPRAQTPPATSTQLVIATPTARVTKALTPIPSDRATCEALGGRWARIGLAPRESCNLPTTDSGKACSDSQQCESLCLAELSRVDQDRVSRTKTPIVAQGKCAPWRIVVGCIAAVEEGMVKTILCID